MAKKVNKVIFGNETIMDVSDATAEAADILEGKTAYAANGEKVTGSYVDRSPKIMTITEASVSQYGTAMLNQIDYNDYAVIAAYAYSSAYPNGILTEIMKVGYYWIIVKDTSGVLIRSTTVNVEVIYMHR